MLAWKRELIALSFLYYISTALAASGDANRCGEFLILALIDYVLKYTLQVQFPTTGLCTRPSLIVLMATTC